MPWTYLATAPNETIARLWVDLLHDEGIDAVVAPSDTMSFLGVSPRPCRVLVAAEQHERARQLLTTLQDAAAKHGDAGTEGNDA